ncbi:MAG TPA: hypothetical protein PLK75_11535, partial [Bacteroidales bacterium]|nr:hypothetical protein [Bacteroidales bacterium]
MKNLFTSGKAIVGILMLIALLSGSLNGYSQCTNCGTNYPSGTTTGAPIAWTTRAGCNYSGEYAYYTLTTGYIYQWGSQGTTYDTQLTLYPSGTCTSGYQLAYNDDFNGNTSLISYEPGTTSVRVLFSKYSCVAYGSGNTCGYQLYRAIPKTPTITNSNTSICTGGSSTLSANSGLVDDVYMDCYWGTSAGGNNVGSSVASVLVSPTTTTTYYLRYLVYGGSAGTRYSSDASTTVTVVADPSISISANYTNICTGGSVTFTQSVSGGTGTITNQWQYSTDNVNWTNWTTTTNPTYSGLTQTMYFRCIRSATASGCDTYTSNTVTVTVNADPYITAHPTGATICTGNSHSMSVTAAGGSSAGLTYQWQSSVIGAGSWTNASTGSSLVATPPYPGRDYRCLVSGTAAHGCSVNVTSNTATVYVDAATV